MRILVLGCKEFPAFTTDWVHSGGMEVYTERMVRSLSSRARFTLYAAAGASDADARVVSLGGARGLRTQPLSLLARSFRRLAAENGQFDLLNPQTPLAALAARAELRRSGTPYVVTVHVFGSDPAHAGSAAVAWLYSQVERLVFRSAAAIIATGRTLGEFLARRYPGVAGKVKVVTAAGMGTQEAADPSETRARLEIPREAPLLLFLGRVVAENGVGDLLHAAALLRRKLPELRLLIAGSGDRDAALHERIRTLGLDGAVRTIPRLRGQEKLDVLAAADLLVRMSNHEVFPEAYLEALSVGTPVAATPAGDTTDLAAASGAIALLPFGDAIAQAEVIEDLLRARERRNTMREHALDYSRRVRWQEQRELYWNVLREAGRRV